MTTTQADGPYDNRVKRRLVAFCIKMALQSNKWVMSGIQDFLIVNSRHRSFVGVWGHIPFCHPFTGYCVLSFYLICFQGLPNTSGLLVRRNVISEKDADVIGIMRRSGAIPLALTNVSELCMWYESSNLIYGRTNNAYHQGRMVGGSSGNLFVLW